jgi:hypothetical protein
MLHRGHTLRLFRWIWVIFMVLATSAPYLVNDHSTPKGFHYTWIIPPYPNDSLAYRTFSQQAAQGSLLFKVKYTALPQAPFLFQPFFLVCGFVSWALGWDIGIVHFTVKAGGVVLFFVVLFRYLDYLRLNLLQSVLATILVGVSSGFGRILLRFGVDPRYYPVDLWLVDSNTYWSLLWNPLFPYVLALLVLGIHLVDRGSQEARNRDLWWGGLCAAVLALIHPYQVPLLCCLATAIVMIRRGWNGVGLLSRFLALALPFALGTFMVSRFDPIAAMHSPLGVMKSPSVIAYLLGFGIPLCLVLAGLAIEWRNLLSRYWQLLLWVVFSVALCYLPFWFQRKLIFGAHVPVCILAAISADRFLSRIARKRMRRWALAGSAILLLPLMVSTQCGMLQDDQSFVGQNDEGAYYISDDLLGALKFLKHNSQPNDIVFATKSTSRFIPSYSGNTVVWGHWAMAVDQKQRTKWAMDVFDGRAGLDVDERRREFWDAGIRFIFVNGGLKQWFDHADSSWLLQGTDKVFENASVTIYRKRLPEAARQ